jgi:dihydroorotate dehydrogenase (NAD+) catalytic subunit
MSAHSAIVETEIESPPDLTVRLGPRLTLPHPVVAAAGTFGYGAELADLADAAQLGALITPTLTLLARMGNPMPRTAEATSGLLHAFGLPNPGLEGFLADTLPGLKACGCPIIVSILGETPQEWASLASALAKTGDIAALEMNLTPLSLLDAERAQEPLPTEAELHAAITAAIAAVRASSLPIIAKLPATGIEIGAAAQTAAAAGADAISVSQAFPGIAVRMSSRKLRFAGAVGGLSGPCIKPLALYQVWRVAQATTLPIIGMGGIMTGEDALEFFVAGASVVAVGIANMIHPTAVAQVTRDVRHYLHQNQLAAVTALRT